MLSFNHYAYGAMIDWVYRTVGGLAPDADDPATVPFTSRLGRRRDSRRRAPRSRRGSGGWPSTGPSTTGVFEATLEVPFGARAVLDLPVTDESIVTVDGAPALRRAVPRHTPDRSSPRPSVAHPSAVATV